MKLPSVPLIVSAVLAVVMAGIAPACDRDDRHISIAVAISPKTVNLASEGVWVTVHAEIPYRDVATVSVSLNGLPVDATKSDDRGDLVAKFSFDVVKKTLSPGTVTLKLAGTTLDGESFSGTDTITVTDNKG